jgi:UDP:flavonoid glycosyltransferase YjiC (YdhE family)
MPYSFVWSLKVNLQVFISPLGIDNQQHLLLDWAPQRFILSHPAIRLFISHGGWNSLLESMSAGKPVLVWPFFADQTMNGYRLEHELGMGRCILNTDLTNGQRIVSSDELARYLKEMFDQEKEYIRKAQQVKKMIFHAKENSSRLYFEEIIKTIDNQLAARRKKHNEL